MKRYFFAALLLTAAIKAGAVNKCSTDGKTAYQDAPCPNEGLTLDNIRPETEAEKLRRNHDAAIVSQRFKDAERLRLANERDRGRREKLRLAMLRSDMLREAAEDRAANRRAGDGKHRKIQYKFKRSPHRIRAK